MSSASDDNDFTVITARTSILFGNGWLIGTLWRLSYVAAAAGSLWLGLRLAKHTEYIAIPSALLAISVTSHALQSKRIPRAFKRMSSQTVRMGAHAQTLALITVLSIGAGHVATRMGFSLPSDKPGDDGEVEQVRAREAAGDFPKRIAAIHAELTIIDGLIAKSNLTMADARLRDVEGMMAPVLRSYAKDFVDVTDVQKRVAATRERITAQRQALADNQASSRMGAINHRLDQVEHEIIRRRFEVAGRLWVKADREINALSDPAAPLSQSIDAAKARLDQQRECIRHACVPPTAAPLKLAKRDVAKRHGARTPKAVATDD